MRIRKAELSDLAVTKCSRGKGTGKLLFRETQHWFAINNIDRTELRVADTNVNACGFWRKMGFTSFITTMYREENQDTNRNRAGKKEKRWDG
ncbi:MAG: GNAT family N-acetyltransferase [bacterium]|nr:GNAT family N-acetyltransferase [bacterium]